MRSIRTLHAVDSHTEGMPTRVVVGGVGVIPGATMAEKRLHFMAEMDDLRTLLMSDWFHLPRHDPRLPLPLQPRGWAGQDAFALFQRLAGVLEKPALSYLAGLRAS